MSALTGIAEIARAARVGDLDAINVALDRMEWAALDVMRGRSVAERPADPPLPALEIDSIALIELERRAPFVGTRRSRAYRRSKKARAA